MFGFNKRMGKLIPIVGVLLALALILGVYAIFGVNRKSLVARTNPDTLPDQKKATELREYVIQKAKETGEVGMTPHQLAALDAARSPIDGYLIGYTTEYTDGKPKGTLVIHGVPTDVFCDANHPECDEGHKKMIGKDLYDFKTVDGVYEVRLWIDIAKEGGGWATTYWKDQWGKLRPKYYYIAPVPGRPYLLASGYFA